MPASVHGTAPTLVDDCLAEAEFYDFAPMPCFLCGCLINDETRKRMFARIYDNRIVINKPMAPCCCLTMPICIADSVTTIYFDKPPIRSGPAPAPFCCIPFTCCGPPVMFSHSPKCITIDCKDWCGETVKTAPCNCYGLKQYLVCGNPCYTSCSMPLLSGVKDAGEFISAAKAAVDTFRAKHGLDESEMAIFECVTDNLMDFGGAKKAKADTGVRKEAMKGGGVKVGKPMTAQDKE
jgi:hypothetical protein